MAFLSRLALVLSQLITSVASWTLARVRTRAVLWLALQLAFVCGSTWAWAATTAPLVPVCTGPAACCITDPTVATKPTRVRLGMRVLGVSAISERDGSFKAEYSLFYRWPAGGLRPDLVPRNVAEVPDSLLDETSESNGLCYRERRIQGTFDAWFRLRRFPFDTQDLRLTLEHRGAPDGALVFENELWPNMLAKSAYRELTGWTFTQYPHITVQRQGFAFVPKAPQPQFLAIEIPVVRSWPYYVWRYFVPLFLIVVLAYMLFWIRPDDLGSASSIGITCVLSVIAFQMTQTDALPRVPYLTIADRVYILCYVMTSLALVITVSESFFFVKTHTDIAYRLDRLGRRWYPVVFLVGILIAAISGWYSQTSNANDDLATLPPATPPAGETAPSSGGGR